jgi:hypothetical protein
MASRGRGLKRLDAEQLASIYLTAKERVIDAGFAEEIDWLAGLVFEELNESAFLRESAWVVLSSGFRESILRRKFSDVSAAFLDWVSAELIVVQAESCRDSALRAFRHQGKIDAIVSIVQRVATQGIERIKEEIRTRGTLFIQELPFMGPVTACHLAKNLGFPMVKPDRHLTRMARHTGYKSADQMCHVISEMVGDSVSVVDLVFWRYATITDNYDREFGD